MCCTTPMELRRMNDREFSLKYKVVRVIQEALYGHVYVAMDLMHDRVVALKVMNTAAAKSGKHVSSGQKIAEDIYQELRALQNLQSNSNVITLLDSFELARDTVFVLEFATHGELFNKLRDDGTFTLDAAGYYFAQLAYGLRSIHHQNYAHRDISLENALVMENDRVVWTDFGVSTEVEYSAEGKLRRVASGSVGKILYMAPEAFNEVHLRKARKTPNEIITAYDPSRADVWSLGICLFLMLTGFTPVERPDESDVRFRYIKAGKLKNIVTSWGMLDIISERVFVVLDGMLQVDPTKRWTMDRVCENAWVKGILEKLNREGVVQLEDRESCGTDIDQYSTASEFEDEEIDSDFDLELNENSDDFAKNRSRTSASSHGTFHSTVAENPTSSDDGGNDNETRLYTFEMAPGSHSPVKKSKKCSTVSWLKKYIEDISIVDAAKNLFMACFACGASAQPQDALYSSSNYEINCDDWSVRDTTKKATPGFSNRYTTHYMLN